MTRREYVLDPDSTGVRLDQALSRSAPDISRRGARALIEAGQVFVDGRRVRVASRKMQAGLRVVVHSEPAPDSGGDLVVLYEDARIIVLNKAPGQHLNETETSAVVSIVEQLRIHYHDIRVVHRLDRDTSGVVVLAKHRDVAEELSRAFRERTVKKVYLAIVEGEVDAQLIDAPIATDPRRPRSRRVHASGKAATTRIEPVDCIEGISAVRAAPVTGRTHQIRVHLAHIGAPLVGDRLYAGPTAVRVGEDVVRPERALLHACRLSLPLEGGERVFEAPLPADLAPFERFGLALGRVFA